MFLTKNNEIKWWAIVLGTLITIVLVFLGVKFFDEPLTDFATRFNYDWVRMFSDVFCTKNWLFMSLLAVVVFFARKILRMREKMSVKDVVLKIKSSYAFFVFCSVWVAAAVGAVLKFAIGRGRPVLNRGADVFSPCSWDWFYNSMPSGHALLSFAGLVMIGLLAPRARWFTWSLAILIGASRIVLGVHWTTDVILGAFVGMVCADVVKSVLTRKMK